MCYNSLQHHSFFCNGFSGVAKLRKPGNSNQRTGMESGLIRQAKLEIAKMLKLSTLEIELLGENLDLEIEWDDVGGGIYVETAAILKRSDYDEKGVFCKNGHWTRVDIYPLLNESMASMITAAIMEERNFLEAA